MLPFLQKKYQTGVIVSTRKPDEKVQEDQDDGKSGMKAAAQDILRAIKADDHEHLALALQNAFEIFDSSPHEEFDHSEDYDSQNIKAGDK